MTAAQVFAILKWINCLDYDEFLKALGLDVAEIAATPHRQEYWLAKFTRIRSNLFEGLCRELDGDYLEKLWAYAVAKDQAYKSKRS